ncbi:BTB/POZ domain and ankyrin repeat-containing protein NPR1-like isoform X2 [Salvia miltiorrhiza]|uniref:BTB/POZ domain and ankyrin repeat-containing protein NPR1-like isoform X2 n=1 Tax=Salvia miltiorrhiza TaxID=226208 RepID=UPI0025AC35C7|nr:BTB/POZ domain and ankyrin repeat-containing protein NPR1-like isoform X2 [Salvia miltiorrhiza]XP_057792864.1 BTB/POZ domain and ankyrin repeat-containing protein NPR1-like isoform X2 [Salvia miltiorrhiza]
MENGNDPSSSLSFASSSYLSNGSSGHNAPSSNVCEVGTNLEFLSLSRLSLSLERLVVGSDYDYSDAEVEVEGVSVGVNRCILAARSEFFHQLFRNTSVDSSMREVKGKPKYLMKDLVPEGRVCYEAFMVVLNYLYTGKVRASPTDVSTCVDESCAHDACGPAINYAVEMMYASATFQIKELVMVVQRRLLNFVDKAYVEDVMPILMVAFHCGLQQLLSHCLQRVARSDVDNIILEKELPVEVLNDVRSLRLKSNQDEEHNSVQVDPLNEKRVRKIHRALDSDDVELVKKLLEESNISLDAACALHYATAYCVPKIVYEVLNLESADVNLRNSRGYTVLHVAARRKDPEIIVGLLNRGAVVSDATGDGQTPLSICRRLTRPKDFNEAKEHGQETNTDRLCIDVLEREMRRNPLAGNISLSSMMVADDVHMRLLLLENRVAMARSLFPLEARLAMQIAHADSTMEFAGLSAANGAYGSFKEVDLNEIPSDHVRRLHLRLQALQKTVETGRRFFPNCSEVLDQLLEDDTLGALLLEKGSMEEQRVKRQRYMELKQDVMKAFSKDLAEHKWPGLSSSSSCSDPRKVGGMHKVRRR